GREPVGTVAVATLEQAARDGIAEGAQGAPEGSGAAAVEALRHRVWARPVGTTPGGAADGPGVADGPGAADAPGVATVPAGTALAVHALGFAPAGRAADAATVHRTGP